MFSLSDKDLDAEALKLSVRDDRSGACVTFEGWVRNHNEGRQVNRLEYEAYEAVALSEGNRILEDAYSQFGLHHAVCVHRVGSLDIGGMAVWVGVSSSHRGEGFAACRFIIDAIKHRLPIWKKEHYVDGDSGWVNCERCAEHAHEQETVSQAEQAAFYSRQICLKEVGPAGQQKLSQSSVLVVGAGGLGSSAMQYLASAGIGHIGICESDVLETSNLHRQTLYTYAEVGEAKAELAATRLRAINPFIKVTVHPERLDGRNVAEVVDTYDTLIDCTDNFETKYLLNDAAVLMQKRLVHAGIYQYEGQLFVYDPEEGTPCLRCIWPEMPLPGCVGSCAEVGVLGAVPGVLGTLQALEAVKHILDLPGKLAGPTLFVDLLDYSMRRVKAERAADCPICGENPSITAIKAQEPVDVDFETLTSLEQERFELIDIREAEEGAEEVIANHTCRTLPVSQIDMDAPPLDKEKHYLLVCDRGMRSKYLAMKLRRDGYRFVYSLKDGCLRRS
jgi:adenylyltransferase/sulfurtransferase